MYNRDYLYIQKDDMDEETDDDLNKPEAEVTEDEDIEDLAEDAMPNDQEDPVSILKDDHATIKALFDDFEDSDIPDDKESIAEQIYDALDAHAKIEEEIFYPALKRTLNGSKAGLIDKSVRDHQKVEKQISELRTLRVTDGNGIYAEKIGMLRSNVMSHVLEEEENLFPLAEDHFDNKEEIARKLRERRNELIGSP